MSIDSASVVALGFGMLDGEGLADLEDKGLIEQYIDGNVIKFRLTESGLRKKKVENTASSSVFTPPSIDNRTIEKILNTYPWS